MNVRIIALAGLAGELRGLTVAMGSVLVRAATIRERAHYYEDHF